jgi:hypothetical protein
MSLLFGCDFSSSPSRRKPIVIATGHASNEVVTLDRIESFATLDAWGDWLASTPEWIGGFDFPFGLPRELVETLGWPLAWPELIAHYASLSRHDIRTAFAAFCAARPVGGKFAHRAADGPAGSSPSMKWVNPPVAFMLHAGVPRLIAAGAVLPGLHSPAGRPRGRVALEAYPGLLARELIGRRSYKNDAVALQTPERRSARDALVTALEAGATRLRLRIALTAGQRNSLVADASGDRLDAVLCLVQAAWCAERASSAGPGFGLPLEIDPIEGWIATA